MPRQTKLSVPAKEAIVRALACFDPPSAIVGVVRKEFGVNVTRQTVQGYDPTKTAGRHCSERWRQLFEATRQAFIRDTAEIPLAHRAVRLRALSRLAAKAEEAGKLALAASILEIAAKEVGDAFTNTRKVAGPGGGPLEIKPITSGMSVQEAAEAYRRSIQLNPPP